LALPFDLHVEGIRWLKDLGLSSTPLNDTLLESMQYFASMHWPKPKTGLTLGREAEIISTLPAVKTFLAFSCLFYCSGEVAAKFFMHNIWMHQNLMYLCFNK
jgi:hypothetical protein